MTELDRQAGRNGEGAGKQYEMKLFYARLLEESGDDEGALAQHLALARQNIGEEARCRAGLTLLKLGRPREAREQFEEVVKNAEILPKHYRKAQREWIELAHAELGKLS